jgi:hypothetical protein
MPTGFLLRTAGLASFAIALSTPWQFESDLIGFVAELIEPGAGSVAVASADRPAPGGSGATPVVEAPASKLEPESARTRWTAEVVIIAPRAEERPVRMPAGWSENVAAPRDRAALGRALQTELKRVGCYDGELHGVWTPGTRRAMIAFTERVNAVLPTDEPDPVLLALVRGHVSKACGVPCPAAQSLSADGRCVPTALLAAKTPSGPGGHSHSARSPAALASAWSSTTKVETAAPAPLPHGPPMGLAGPQSPGEPAVAGGEPLVGQPAAPPRAANPAPRPPAQQTGFGPWIFRQVERNGW